MPSGARKSYEPEVLGAADAALRLGVAQSNLRTVAGLPEPYQKRRKRGEETGYRTTTLYRATDIDRLAAERAMKEGTNP